MLEEINEKIEEVGVGAGNKRVISIEIDKGEIRIIDNGGENELYEQNTIVFILEESRSVYSEPVKDNTFISIGNVEVQTKQVGKVNTVKLKLDYSKYELEYEGSVLTKSPSPYKITIENKGKNIIKISVS
jgi:hypothetical protein